jgi:hypothetical protein
MKRIPKEMIVKDLDYKITVTGKLPKHLAGECDFADQVIRISKFQSNREKRRTFWHEISHAIDEAYNIGLTHKQVYKLEEALYCLFRDNL